MADQVVALTLPGLQARLDALEVGQELAISLVDYRRLFGENDVAVARLSRFAEGHGCAVDPRPSLVVFRRTQPARR
jgi:hypothetical protein